MNSDPFDSAAWRTFNMLSPNEAKSFDDAMRRDPALRSACLEMDRLSAAIAAATATPITPQPGQFEQVQSRLGFGPPKSPQFWLAVSGWATATVLAVALVLILTGVIGQWGLARMADGDQPHPKDNPATIKTTGTSQPNRIAAANSGKSRSGKNPAPSGLRPAAKESDNKSTAKVESKHLNQEIELPRDNLDKAQNRDRALFDVVPGMALPIVMTMNPPSMAADDPTLFAKSDERSPLTTLLGDALTSLTGASTATADPPDHPTAIPIYDAARDQGALAVSNLPPAPDGECYNLWVTTQNGSRPIYVGTLPPSSASGADTFDFTLGSTGVLPSGFLLTRDPEDAPASPTPANTVLQGPPTAPH